MAIGLVGCSPVDDDPGSLLQLSHLPLDSLVAIVSRSNVVFDDAESADGRGSVRVSVTAPTVVRLYEMGPMEIEGARLVYRAKVRAKELSGKVYLEMWCHFPEKGEFFSRGFDDGLSGTTEWTILETSFLLQTGQRPDNVRLNLVVDGSGTAWVDDIRLLRAPS